MIELVGLPLSFVAIAVFVALLVDWRRRRGRFEPAHIGDSRIGPRAVQWVWLALLVGSFAVAMWGPGMTLATQERHMTEAQPDRQDESPLVSTAQRFRVAASLPSYRLSRTTERTDGMVERVTLTRQLVLPVWFIAVAILYWLLVIRRSGERSAVAAGGAASRS